MKPDDVVDLLPSKIVQMAAVGPYLHYLCEDGSTWMLVISSVDESGSTRRRYTATAHGGPRSRAARP